MNIKYLLIVKPAAGLNIQDRPAPQSQGAIKRRAVGKGTVLNAANIINFQGVKYAQLVPIDPARPEWVRVAEPGSAVNEYVEVIELAPEPGTPDLSDLATELRALTQAVTSLATEIHERKS